MVAASGPTGILAERPSGSERLHTAGARDLVDQNDQEECAWPKEQKKIDKTRHRHETDLYVRPSWTDASIALDQLEKVRNLRKTIGLYID